MFYVWGSNDNLRSFQFAQGQFTAGPQNSLVVGYPGSILAVSSQGGQAGTNILWAADPSGVVHAYNANDVSSELWNSGQNPGRDSLGTLAKFGQPVIADGKVFVPTFSNQVVAYGLLSSNGTGNSQADHVAPTVTCSASPNSIWPPNGKPVSVMVSGNMSDTGSGLEPSTAAFTVADEYNQVQPNGAITPGTGGNYAFNVSLIASRNGNDSDRRLYEITVSVKDKAGNPGSCVAKVVVPHDQSGQ